MSVKSEYYKLYKLFYILKNCVPSLRTKVTSVYKTQREDKEKQPILFLTCLLLRSGVVILPLSKETISFLC